MKQLINEITDMLADAALIEMGVDVAATCVQAGTTRETLEENLIEVAFAEAGDYDDIHNDILRDHRSDRGIVRPDECQCGDNDICFV